MSKYTEATNDFAMNINQVEKNFIHYMTDKYWGEENNGTAFRCGVMAMMCEMKARAERAQKEQERFKDGVAHLDYEYLYGENIWPENYKKL